MNTSQVLERPNSETLSAGPQSHTTEFFVDVVSGDGIPVSLIEVVALYRYPHDPSRRSIAKTDLDGRARVYDHHKELPYEVELLVGREHIKCSRLLPGAVLVIEM